MSNEWVDIKGYEGLYQINKTGNIKALSRKTRGRGVYYTKEIMMKPSINTKGYYDIRLCKDKKRRRVEIHRLLYQAFKGDLIKGMVIDHIDNNPLNNNLDNLQQTTYYVNCTKDLDKSKTKSRFIGVTKDKKGNYIARRTTNGVREYLGYYKTEIGAMLAVKYK